VIQRSTGVPVRTGGLTSLQHLNGTCHRLESRATRQRVNGLTYSTTRPS
jgi:hypothetical protein